jgi:hypothetical protein
MSKRTGKLVVYDVCACGNESRYINERGELCCGLCPIKERIDSILLTSKGQLHQWISANAEQTGFDPEEVERIRKQYMFQASNDHWLDQAVDELRWARRYLDATPNADTELRSLLGRHPGRMP